jgi:hypothetical protein
VNDVAEMKEYGLLIKQSNRFGTEHIEALVVCREKDREAPLGCSGDGERAWDGDVPPHMRGMQLDGLCCDGHISDYGGGEFIGFAPEYRDVFSIELDKLQRMTKTLKRVVAQKEKDKSYEPGDIFVSFAKALKLTFAVVKNDNNPHRQWNYMTIVEGRNCLRRMIDDAVAVEKKRHVTTG